MQGNPSATAQLLKATQFPVGPDANTTNQEIIELLWYNVFGTNDATAKLGGQPYDNATRIYVGSSDDFDLNLRVAGFSADEVARAEIAAHYHTSGKFSHPVITMHTTSDPIVPYIHEPIHALKLLLGGSALWIT